jgi:hypothetical protein
MASQSGSDENRCWDPNGQPDCSAGEGGSVVVHLRPDDAADQDATDQHHRDDCLGEQVAANLLADLGPRPSDRRLWFAHAPILRIEQVQRRTRQAAAAGETPGEVAPHRGSVNEPHHPEQT